MKSLDDLVVEFANHMLQGFACENMDASTSIRLARALSKAADLLEKDLKNCGNEIPVERAAAVLGCHRAANTLLDRANVSTLQ